MEPPLNDLTLECMHHTTAQCAPGYGLSTDTTKCNKCVDPKCAYCDSDGTVCLTPFSSPIANCAVSDGSNSQCYEVGFPLLVVLEACMSLGLLRNVSPALDPVSLSSFLAI